MTPALRVVVHHVGVGPLTSLERHEILGFGHRKFGEAPAKAAGNISERIDPTLGELYEEGRRPAGAATSRERRGPADLGLGNVDLTEDAVQALWRELA